MTEEPRPLSFATRAELITELIERHVCLLVLYGVEMDDGTSAMGCTYGPNLFAAEGLARCFIRSECQKFRPPDDDEEQQLNR